MKSQFDEYPEFRQEPGLSPENLQSMKRDDFKDFLSHHQGHPLENLSIIEDSFVSEHAYSEPVKTSFFKATNGREKFVIKKSRKRIDEPLKYELISGDYCLNCISLGIQSEEIQKQLRRELTPPPSQDKIDAFLKLMRSIIEDIKVQDLERIPEESRYPLEVYYKMDDIHVVYALRNCRHIFKGQEYSAMEEFIHRHKDGGVLLLKAIYVIQISPKARSRKRVASPLPFEKEAIFGLK